MRIVVLPVVVGGAWLKERWSYVGEAVLEERKKGGSDGTMKLSMLPLFCTSCWKFRYFAKTSAIGGRVLKNTMLLFHN